MIVVILFRMIQMQSSILTTQLPELEVNVFEAILSRRSVRSYTAQQADQQTVHILLEAAVRAPTSLHQEPCAFIVIQNQQLLQRLSDLAKSASLAEASRMGHVKDTFTEPDASIFYNANTLIIIGSYAAGQFVAADCWLAAENLILTACSMGLGSCIVGTALPVLNVPEIKAEFGIPAEYSAIAPIIIGYPSAETLPVSRKEPVVLSIMEFNGPKGSLSAVPSSVEPGF
ncbi:MAG TPA: nitroreductase family protein [Methylophilaceae bacterium]|jgi:nitroreductase